MPRACPVESHGCCYTSELSRRLDATALGRGGSPSQLCSSKREAPRGKPVASRILEVNLVLAASVKLHGASPWHLEFWRLI